MAPLRTTRTNHAPGSSGTGRCKAQLHKRFLNHVLPRIARLPRIELKCRRVSIDQPAERESMRGRDCRVGIGSTLLIQVRWADKRLPESVGRRPAWTVRTARSGRIDVFWSGPLLRSGRTNCVRRSERGTLPLSSLCRAAARADPRRTAVCRSRLGGSSQHVAAGLE